MTSLLCNVEKENVTHTLVNKGHPNVTGKGRQGDSFTLRQNFSFVSPFFGFLCSVLLMMWESTPAVRRKEGITPTHHPPTRHTGQIRFPLCASIYSFILPTGFIFICTNRCCAGWNLPSCSDDLVIPLQYPSQDHEGFS